MYLPNIGNVPYKNALAFGYYKAFDFRLNTAFVCTFASPMLKSYLYFSASDFIRKYFYECLIHIKVNMSKTLAFSQNYTQYIFMSCAHSSIVNCGIPYFFDTIDSYDNVMHKHILDLFISKYVNP